MCQKQCRDENGFKCHQMSESHTRQMALFSENADSMLDEFSSEFERQYMELLKCKGGMRVAANNVYQEHVADRHHVHMNSTRWATLGEFVQYIGKRGLAEVEHEERGWFVTYIKRDPKTLARQEAIAKQEARALDSEQRQERVIQAQIALMQARDNGGDAAAAAAAPSALDRGDDAAKMTFSMATPTLAARGEKMTNKLKRKAVSGGGVDDDDDDDHDGGGDNNGDKKRKKKGGAGR
jgi:DNA/RNA-binding protein KIN17